MSFNEEDVLDGSSPQQEEQTQSADSDSTPVEASEPAQTQVKQEEQPFHMHPRFQEVISEKNALREQNRIFEQKLADMERRFQASQKQEAPKTNPVRERLTGIDKDFAEYVGSVEKIPQLEQQLQEFQQWKQEQAQREVQAQAASAEEKFYSENKVPAEHREIYNAQLRMIAQSNPNLSVSDLPKVLKDVHEKMTKLFKSTERAATKQLVVGKQADAAKPSTQPKGAPAKPGQKEANPKNPQDMRAQLLADTMAEIRAGKDI